jgi:tetratricopeptide (TPR) repeat protein
MSKLKKIICKCNRSLHDTQIFTNGKDILTFKGVFKYAEFKIYLTDLPKPNKSGEILDIDIGDDSEISDYLDENWIIQIKDVKLKKKVQAILDDGADISELNDLGFDNTGGQYDIIPSGSESFIIDDESNTAKVENIETLQSRGKFLVESEEKNSAFEAIEILTKAAKMQEIADPTDMNLLFIKTTLAQAYTLSGNIIESLEIFTEVKNEYLKIEGKYSSGASWINSLISDVYVSQNKFDEAIFYKEQTMLFDEYLPRMIDFAKILSKANRKLDAGEVLKIALNKSSFDNYEEQARIGLELFEVIATETGKHQEALDVLESATLSASLSGDKELLKECKKAEKQFKKK